MNPKRLGIAGAVLVALILPVVLGGHTLFVATSAAILAIAAVGLAAVIAHVGLVSLGHAAFFGLGGYATAVVSTRMGAPLVGVVLGVVVAAVYGAMVGPLALRSRGIGFVMVTLALGELAHVSAGQWVGLTGGDTGLSGVPALPGMADVRVRYVTVLVILLVILAGGRWLTRTTLGRGVDAARQDEHKARSLGFAVDSARLVLFVASAAVAGLAGVLYAHHTSFISPGELSWITSGELAVMVLLGGGRSLMGAAVGAVVLVFLEDVVTSYFEYWELVLGAVFALVVLSGWLNRPRTPAEKIKARAASDETVAVQGPRS